ncbi:MAG: geranylgeranylglycerol-phosphate geranylgeranyltransferase [Desulfurococcaceae archaeon]|jgi:geranylgeranylglycerol-phosphate geranylgeranyltransferase|nr:geranylgeranylglycerol-phosphate geranylgeranyltransferase [Desulfurococcaceae archaeon]MCC6057643.1 geranylgeranylglycerol-phosphate geranylgeranyltransferase [Desulfurococcaceae archaeon]
MRKGFKDKFSAWFSIIRVGNCIALSYAAIIGYLLAYRRYPDIIDVLKLILSVFTIGGSSNIINDYFDAPIDSINKPWRPIPSGIIKPKSALAASIIMGLTGIAIAFNISFLAGLLASVAFTLSYLYSYKLKKVLLVGNIVVAFLAALSIVYGGTVFGINNARISDVAIASLFAFLLNLGREFLKGIEDVVGDKKYGIQTIATCFGVKIAYMSSVVIFSILIMLSIVPYLMLRYSIYYLVIALVGVDLTVLISLIISSTLNPRDALKATRILKIAVFVGISAFLVEALKSI